MTTLTSKAVRFITAAALGLGLLWSAPSRGAPPNTIGNSVAVCDPWNPQRCAQPDASGNLPITGSFSAAGFTPAATGTPISVTTGGVTGTLPAGAVVAAFNVGTTNTAYCKLGASATTSDIAIPPASWFAFTVGAATQLTCITTSGTTQVNMVGGSGQPTGAGGGAGGGGGAVTIANGSDATQGAIADAAPTAGSTGTISAKLRLMTTQLDNINTNIQGSIPACGSSPCTTVIGAVTGFQGTSALSATNGWYFNQLQGNAVLSATNPTFTRLTDGTNAQIMDPCQTVAKTTLAFSQADDAVLIAGTSAKKTYICSMKIIAGAAEIYNIIAGTGSVCGTNTVVLAGSSTQANGLSLAANGGDVYGGGGYYVLATTVNADDLCLTQSGTNRLAGTLTYVKQ